MNRGVWITLGTALGVAGIGGARESGGGVAD